MDQQIRIEHTGDKIVFVHVQGDIDTSNYHHLEGAVDELNWDDFERLILNMEEVPYMSSCGIGLLMRLHNNAGEQGKTLVLLGLNDAVRQVLEATKLLAYFTVAGSREEALSAEK